MTRGRQLQTTWLHEAVCVRLKVEQQSAGVNNPLHQNMVSTRLRLYQTFTASGRQPFENCDAHPSKGSPGEPAARLRVEGVGNLKCERYDVMS